MGKRFHALLFSCFMLLAGQVLHAQQNAKEQLLEIMASKQPDSIKLRMLVQRAVATARAGDSATLLFTNEARKFKDASSTNLFYRINEVAGIYYLNRFNYDSSSRYFNSNLERAVNENNLPEIAEAYQKLGETANAKGVYPGAIEYHSKSLEYYERLSDSNGITLAYDALGQGYIRLNQPQKTIELLKKAIPIANRSGKKKLLAKLYNTIGSAYADLNNDTLVISYQMQALQIFKELNDAEGLVTTSINLGQLYAKRKNYDEAGKYYRYGILHAKVSGTKRDLGVLYYNLGLIYYNMNQKADASVFQDSSIYYASLVGDKLVLSKAYRQKSFIYIDNENYKEGYEYFRKYNNLNDSIYTESMQSNISAMQTRYETEKKERRAEQEHFANVKRNMWIVGILIFLAATILILLSWFKRQKLQEEKRFHQAIIAQQDMATRAVIQAEENERKRIAGDLHDGVGQMMSAAKMNLSSFESKAIFRSDEERASFDKIITLVDDSCNEVRNVSHNMMPNALLKSGLASAVKEFIEKIDSRKLKVNLHAEGLNERLDRNVETVLYRVIQECVNNVIKHACANHLDISLIKDSDGISATIEDNGKGFDIKQKDKFDGIGLKNIETRIEYLKGTIDFDSRPGRGTLVAIHVPLNQQNFKAVAGS